MTGEAKDDNLIKREKKKPDRQITGYVNDYCVSRAAMQITTEGINNRSNNVRACESMSLNGLAFDSTFFTSNG